MVLISPYGTWQARTYTPLAGVAPWRGRGGSGVITFFLIDRKIGAAHTCAVSPSVRAYDPMLDAGTLSPGDVSPPK